MIRVAVVAILFLGSALALPFDLDFARLDAKMKQLERLSGQLTPYSGLKLSPFKLPPPPAPFRTQKQPQFSAHFGPQSLQLSFGQHSPVQESGPDDQQQYNPQDYLADPLGSFPPKSYSLTYDQADLTKMVGENFFKRPVHGQQDQEETSEEIPYSVLQDFGTYEQRFYPAAKFACVKSEVDISKDPMAGLEKENPFMIMTSKRWKKSPSSIMFMELFKYIAGVNQEGQEVEMTRPVSTLHKVEQKQAGGDIEVQEMCFYIPQKFQASPPEPLARSPVYIMQRPEMAVFALRFGGFALTADTWLAQKDLLERYIVGKAHRQNEYFTNGYNSPFALTDRRNEIWIQCTAHETKPAEAAEAAPLPSDATKPVPLPALVADPAPLPADATKPAVLPADETKPAVLPADATKPAQLPADATKPAILPADATKPALLPADATKPVPLPADETKPAPLPADVADVVPLPADATKPAPLPADVAEAAPLPADATKPAVLPAEVADAAALPADATKPVPLPADIVEAAPLPADAAEPADATATVEGVSA